MKLVSACTSILLALTPIAATQAQASDLHFNIGAGASIPNGDFGSHNDVGYNVLLGLGTTPRGSPLGFRVEGIYNEFSVSNGGNAKSHAGGVTANAIYAFNVAAPGTTGNSLYVIGGLGYYTTREPFLINDSETNFGWNVGAGFRFPLTGFSAYIEARYHTVSNTDVRFTPITFGLIF
ncbi:MAG TPA: outer membrane beta-barrel protein [Gemmatimonadaceae bacterium]|nr:outer membrane beta-barrel protein [Gemmatimonadaceae bacterium]